MNTLFKNIWCLILMLTAWNSQAQQTTEVQLNDNIELEADTFRGTIQWQISVDNETWDNIDLADVNPFTVVVTVLPSYFRAEIAEQGCAAHYSETISVVSSDVLLWSVTNTWGEAGKPVAGEEVIIPAGVSILLDESPPDLGGITIEEGATLAFDRQDLNLTSEWIIVNGTLEIGTEEAPFEQKAILTLNDTESEADPTGEGMGTRGIIVINGTLQLHGATPNVLWTKINAHAESGSTSLELMEAVDWNAGDEIVIAPTDYYEAGFGVSITQRVSLSDVSGQQLTLAEGLNAHRWGLLQYPTNAGMSLSQADIVSPPIADTNTTTTPLVLDERAEVGNMTRNIVVQSPDDDLWNSQGFGVHTMIMPGASAHVEGVEFKRGGQRSRLRRYPFHWHMLSYAGGETLDDATGQYFRKNTINSSANRGVVIHGTNGVLVQDNIIYDIRGHGIFTEDAVERRNVIDGNLVLHIRNPAWGDQLKEHEVGTFGSSGFWISNPDNTVINNTVADSETFGYWLTYPVQPWGMNKEVLHTDGLVLRPNRLLFGVFDNNTAHSNKNDGIHLDDVQMDDAGNTFPLQYWSTADGRTDGWPFDALRRFSLSRFKTWKNMDNGSWDRGVWTDIFEVVSADNCGRFFAGSGAEGIIERSLVVGTSLNFLMNGTGRPDIADFQFFASAAPVAFATYHSAFSMRENVVVNFPVTEYDRAGVFASDDYYVRPVDKGQIRNYDNLLIASHPGVKIVSEFNYFTLASALWDPYGHWGPAGNYFVYADTFLTYGKNVTIIEQGTEAAGGVSVPGPFYGFLDFVLHGVGDTPPQNQPYFDLMAIHVRRLEVVLPTEGPFWNELTEIATWDVASAQPEWTLNHMRDFATTPSGIYELTFPDEAVPPTDFQMSVENMLETDDEQIIGIQYDGSLDPTVFIQQTSDLNNFIVYDEVALFELIFTSDGPSWWQDKANNLVVVKIVGGVWQSPTGGVNDSFEDSVNETMLLRIRVPD